MGEWSENADADRRAQPHGERYSSSQRKLRILVL
jgi:hypothetical protein